MEAGARTPRSCPRGEPRPGNQRGAGPARRLHRAARPELAIFRQALRRISRPRQRRSQVAFARPCQGRGRGASRRHFLSPRCGTGRLHHPQRDDHHRRTGRETGTTWPIFSTTTRGAATSCAPTFQKLECGMNTCPSPPKLHPRRWLGRAWDDCALALRFRAGLHRGPTRIRRPDGLADHERRGRCPKAIQDGHQLKKHDRRGVSQAVEGGRASRILRRGA